MALDFPDILIGLAVTIIVEFVVALCFRFRSKRELLSVVLVNLISLPLAVLLLMLVAFYVTLSTIQSYVVIGFIEVAVVALEAALYRYALRLAWKRAATFSFVANAASLLVGLIIFSRM